MQHEKPRSVTELARVFGCPIEFETADTELVIPLEVLRLPHLDSDSGLSMVLSKYAESLLPGPPEQGNLLEKVSAFIAQHLPEELPSLPSTAEAVRMPERTLQRRLAERGLTHWNLVDSARRELALKYVSDARLNIGEIAYLLHFADATAFHRAFRRWTGEAPAEYRSRLFGGPAREMPESDAGRRGSVPVAG